MSDAPQMTLVAQAVSLAHLENSMLEAYAAGRRAVVLMNRGQPYKALADHWTHFAQAPEVRNAFYLGVEDEP